MQIIETGLPFGPLRIRWTTSLIVIHHSASQDVSSRIIHGWHWCGGWSGIGYHFVIRQDGSIERGRPQEAVGAHAGAKYNSHSLGICLCGNFMNAKPTAQQMASLGKLIVRLNQVYAVPNPSGMDVKLHREVARTSCPGDMSPTDALQQRCAAKRRRG